jgi:hypothetical protein
VATAAFFRFTFSWVEIPLFKVPGPIDAKPFGGIMSGVDGVMSANVPLMAAAGVPDCIPCTLHSILKHRQPAPGFSLGRVSQTSDARITAGY